MKFLKKLFGNNTKQNVRDIIVDCVSPIMDDYANWNAEHGMYLPPGLETNPSEWANILRKIQRAFCLLEYAAAGEGDFHLAKMKGDVAEIEKLNGEIKEGFELFGKYLLYLKDPNYEPNA